MLITFGALVPEGALFSINDKFEEDFTKYVSKKRTISQEQLLTKIEQERIIGEKGEAFVLSFEKKRCPFTYKQLKRIKQISIVDASAGYDVLSFENELSDAKRYIEVKTYCGNVHFYWSSNEIEAAKLRNASYYLYLVDYTKINIEGYAPLMIPNPYVNIKKLSVWDMQPSSYIITSEKEECELKSIFSSDRQNDVADETHESTHSKTITFYYDEDKEEDRYSMAAESVIPANELTEEQRIDVLRKSLVQMFNHGGYLNSDKTFCKQRHWISVYRIVADEGFIIEGDFKYFKHVVEGMNLSNCKVPLNVNTLERNIKGIYASSFETWNDNGMTEDALKEYNDIRHCAEVFLNLLSNNRPKR